MEKYGKYLLYVNFIKSLYFLLKIALLFKKNFVNYLQYYGLNTNPLNQGTLNVIINGRHITATWNVDYLKVSHKDPVQIIKFVYYLSSIYDN